MQVLVSRCGNSFLKNQEYASLANAVKLEYDTTISGITLSYKEGDNWVEINDNNQDLPAGPDSEYQFTFT